MKIPAKRRRFTYTQLIVLSFLGVILVGGFLLILPISSSDRTPTSPLTAYFTATSATCVTGLIVADTYTQWSLFGQVVILTMIQIGGLGFMTVMTAFAMMMKKNIGLHERSLLMQSAGSTQYSGGLRLVRRILCGTLLFEGIGALLLSIRFIPRYGVGWGIWNAIFHSVSAFCNAGFDLMGKESPYSSLTAFTGDPLVCLTVMALIVLGGIGFLVWNDVVQHGWHVKRYQLHSRLVLSTTAVLLLLGFVLFLILERNGELASLPIGEKLLAAAFQSVTMRTAGFNTIDLSRLSEGGVLLSVVLMLIGGSPGSTAGGLKTTTAAVLFLETIAAATKKKNVTVFRRRLDDSLVKRASAILSVYLFFTIAGTLLLCAIEPYGMKEILFEVSSAMGTVGLSMGLTPTLHTLSRVVIMFLMFTGRIGGLSLVLALGEKRKLPRTERPSENILIG